jgi:hypothetical protein
LGCLQMLSPPANTNNAYKPQWFTKMLLKNTLYSVLATLLASFLC